MWELQTTRYPLPTDVFRATYGHHNETSFRRGIDSSLAWLRFIGLHEPHRSALSMAAASN
jgi:hypothetical protein